MARILRQPATLILIAANLVPLIGVILWHWDAFILLMLYWLETAIVAFWAVLRIAIMPRDALGNVHFEDLAKPALPLAFAAFVTFHAGIFMTVHFFLLWELFSGSWAQKVHGPRDFVAEIIVGTGLWLPLLVLFVARGGIMLFELAEPALRRAFRLLPRPTKPSLLGSTGTALMGLYLRIFIMQVTLILGGMVAVLTSTVVAYVLLVALKTAVDVMLQSIAEAVNTALAKAKSARSAGG